MRVIAGEKRHLVLKTLSDLSIRPTTDKIKETLFNMIQFDIPGANFLDLFAGSGAIGIEALSRMANFATFVDNNVEAIKVINDNLSYTGLVEKSKVLRRDARTVIGLIESDNIVYDIVFMDPPYDRKLYLPIFDELSHSKIIDSDTKIILETSIRDDVSDVTKLGYVISKVKEYKTNKHIFFRRG